MTSAAGAMLAILHIDKGEYVEAVDQMREVLPELACYQPVYGLVFTGVLAATEARVGRVVRSRARLDAILHRPAPPFVRAVLELCERVVEHAEGKPVSEPPEADAPLMKVEHSAVRSLLRSQLEGTATGGIRVKNVVVGTEGLWFSANHERVELGRRAIMRRLLIALSHAGAMSSQELLKAGWGDEKMSPSSGQRRLEVMISRLRAVGLGDAIESIEGGYRFHPQCKVSFSGRP
ncbi:MAG: helix-turn-helix domain-containing protein [Myxococcota bacterium]